jgi:hypothetical protein
MYFVVLYVFLGASNFRLGIFKDVVLTVYSQLFSYKSQVTNSEIIANIPLMFQSLWNIINIHNEKQRTKYTALGIPHFSDMLLDKYEITVIATIYLFIYLFI